MGAPDRSQMTDASSNSVIDFLEGWSYIYACVVLYHLLWSDKTFELGPPGAHRLMGNSHHPCCTGTVIKPFLRRLEQVLVQDAGSLGLVERAIHLNLRIGALSKFPEILELVETWLPTSVQSDRVTANSEQLATPVHSKEESLTPASDEEFGTQGPHINASNSLTESRKPSSVQRGVVGGPKRMGAAAHAPASTEKHGLRVQSVEDLRILHDALLDEKQKDVNLEEKRKRKYKGAGTAGTGSAKDSEVQSNGEACVGERGQEDLMSPDSLDSHAQCSRQRFGGGADKSLEEGRTKVLPLTEMTTNCIPKKPAGGPDGRTRIANESLPHAEEISQLDNPVPWDTLDKNSELGGPRSSAAASRRPSQIGDGETSRETESVYYLRAVDSSIEGSVEGYPGMLGEKRLSKDCMRKEHLHEKILNTEKLLDVFGRPWLLEPITQACLHSRVHSRELLTEAVAVVSWILREQPVPYEEPEDPFLKKLDVDGLLKEAMDRVGPSDSVQASRRQELVKAVHTHDSVKEGIFVVEALGKLRDLRIAEEKLIVGQTRRVSTNVTRRAKLFRRHAAALRIEVGEHRQMGVFGRNLSIARLVHDHIQQGSHSEMMENQPDDVAGLMSMFLERNLQSKTAKLILLSWLCFDMDSHVIEWCFSYRLLFRFLQKVLLDGRTETPCTTASNHKFFSRADDMDQSSSVLNREEKTEAPLDCVVDMRELVLEVIMAFVDALRKTVSRSLILWDYSDDRLEEFTDEEDEDGFLQFFSSPFAAFQNS